MPIKSKELVAACLCGQAFPLRIYFLTEPMPELMPREVERAAFLVTCRCGKTFPLEVEGYGAPPLGGEKIG